MSRAANRAIVALFLLVLALPVGVNLAGVDGADAGAENRTLAAFPLFNGSWASATAFPAGLAAWFDDHFGFRARLVRWFGESRLFVLGVSPSSAVGLGRNGWLFYLDDFGLEDYANVSPLTPSEQANWHEAIVRARDWMRRRGGSYVFTVVPDKHVIYPEAFPELVARVGSTSRTDQVFASIADSGVGVDVRPPLLEAKTSERVYQLTDTHWNDVGAFTAYQPIIEAVRAQNPAVPPAWQAADFTLTRREVIGMDLAGMIGLKRLMWEQELELVPKRPRRARVVEPVGAEATAEEGRLVTEIPDSTLPRAVIFRDSFA